MFKVGFGQDSHRFSDDKTRKLMLGGVEVADFPVMEGNSDGDVVIHAICNALEQSVGGDSFSSYADPMCFEQGITDSMEYLKIAFSHVKEEGYRVNNLGITIEAKQPRISSIADQIKEKISEVLEIKKEDIGINSTSGDNMTPFGKGEGVQVFAIVSVIKS